MPTTPKTLQKYFETMLAAELGPYDLKRLIESEKGKLIVLDVRRGEDFATEHVPGAVHIPFEQLEKRYKEIPKKNQVVAYCYTITCGLAPKTAAFLAKKGYRASILYGGIAEWKSVGFSIETGAAAKPPQRTLVTA